MRKNPPVIIAVSPKKRGKGFLKWSLVAQSTNFNSRYAAANVRDNLTNMLKRLELF